MALTNVKPRLAALSARVGYLPDHVASRERKRGQEQPWRAWYKTARWEKLRQAVFLRDMWTCQRSGTLCTGKHPSPDSPVANHKTRHRGNPDLFWNIDNIETVTKAVHDSLIQKEEQANPTGVWD